jgi:hypothetical protein
LPGNPDHHLVEVPAVAWARAGPSQPSCDPGPEFQNPAPYRLIGNLHAALGQEILDSFSPSRVLPAPLNLFWHGPSPRSEIGDPYPIEAVSDADLGMSAVVEVPAK